MYTVYCVCTHVQDYSVYACINMYIVMYMTMCRYVVHVYVHKSDMI